MGATDGFDRSANAKALHKHRRSDTDKKANDAIDRLVKADKKVTFKAVAEEAGVTTATLYKHDTVRKRIEQLRDVRYVHPKSRRPSSSSESATVESLKRKAERLAKENERLREENRRLKQAADKVYSDYLDAV